MLKEMLRSRFETYLLDEQLEQEEREEMLLDEHEEQQQYPPGFFTAL